MKLYRMDFYHKDFGRCVQWFGSEAAAKKEFRRLFRERKQSGGEPQGPEGVERVDIVGGKAGLLNWLNREFTRDNG